MSTLGDPAPAERYVRLRARLRRRRQAAPDEARLLAKSAVLATISHELRTPMNAVLGAAELLTRTRLDAEQRGYVALLRRAGDGLITLVDAMRDLSAGEAGRLTLEPAPFRLADVVGRAIAGAAIAGEAKGLVVTAELAPGLPETLVGDARRLGQVLHHLLGNAVKFTARGRVTLTVGPDPAEPAPGALRVVVADTGPGIPAGQLAAIFERFTQLDAGTTRRHGGTGLGLAIAGRLVALMGGTIHAESAPGVGSAFVFTARLAPAPAGPAAQAAAGPAGGPRPLAILLAEDVADNRLIFEAYFAGTPHAVTWAVDGTDAVARFQAGRFDLVLMDMQMPLMDGYDATRAIRAWERARGLPPTPILAMTASVMAHEVARCRAAGCDGHLAKPLRRRELLDAVARYM